MNMFGGDEDPFGHGGPAAGLFAQLAQGFGGALGQQMRRPPRAYDDYMKAYSVAMLPGRQRANLSYGGKIIMPPSALARLTSLDLESPWMFRLSNPSNPAASTHAGVLEFIAEEGVVHLPYWMMKTLRLNEGDAVRITGAELPKGKFVKLQAQSVHFLEISDPKAVLEQALRNFTTLTQGDIIEIMYNSIVFELLIMETKPGGAGISVLDTDLEVDFAAPKGYVEPERPKPAPPPTMASKLNIDVSSSTPGSSRPSSSLGGTFGTAASGAGAGVVSKGGEEWETFKGRGETLGGRKTKGRGISHRKIEDFNEGSKIYRSDKHQIVTTDDLERTQTAPAPLRLPFGKLFFGYKYIPYVEPENNDTSGTSSSPSAAAASSSQAFTGSGNTLSGRVNASQRISAPLSSDIKGKGKEKKTSDQSKDEEEKKWGKGGQTLTNSARSTNGAMGAGGARVPQPPVRNSRQQMKQKEKERSPTPDWGVEDDDVIIVDSD